MTPPPDLPREQPSAGESGEQIAARWTRHDRARLAREIDSAISAAREDLDRWKHAARTRTDYDFRCQDCGAAHIIDCSLPSPIWNAICENREGIKPGAAGIGMPEVGALCPLCIDARLVKAGLECREAEFYYCGAALSGKVYAESHGTIAMLEREVQAAEHRATEAASHEIALADCMARALRRVMDRPSVALLQPEVHPWLLRVRAALTNWELRDVHAGRASRPSPPPEPAFDNGCECDGCCRLEELRVKCGIVDGTADEVAATLSHVLDAAYETPPPEPAPTAWDALAVAHPPLMLARVGCVHRYR